MSRLLRVPLSPLTPGVVVLGEATGRYVTRVHRLGDGDRFLAFDPEARTEAEVTIVSVARDVHCEVSALRPASAVAREQVTLLQAIGKGDKPEQVVRDATALGATRVVLVVTARSVARPDSGDAAKARRYRTVAVEAARQSGRGDLPVVVGPVSLEDALASAGDGLRVCLAPDASGPLGAVLAAWEPSAPLAVLIGPEGGLAPTELALAREKGFVLASLGDFVLRTETAAVAALGAVSAIGALRRRDVALG